MSQGQVPPNESSRKRWRESAPVPEGPGAPPVSERGKKLVGLLTLLLALLGAVAAMIFYLRGMPQPQVLTLAIREYKSDLWPVNSMALQDSLVLKKRFGEDNVDQPYIQDVDRMMSKLRELKKKAGAPVVVHLCALARWRDGKVYLVGGQADPDRETESTWVPLADVLQRLRDCPAADKLLILDVMRTGPDERFGFFADDIAGKVHEELAKEKDFFILSACSPGQSSQVSEELGQSVFVHYIDQGLRGYADGYGPHGNQDRRITVTELAEFVKARVDRWAWETRGLRQTPVLLGKGNDFPLAQFEDPALTQPEEIKPAASFPDWLREGWALRDQWRRDINRLGPGIVRSLEAVLLRAEQRWRGGIEEPRLKSDLQTDRKKLEVQIQRIKESRRPTLPRSLAPGLAEDKKSAAPGFMDALARLLPRALDPTVKLEEKDKAKKEALDKEIKELQAQFNKQPVDAAWALFETAAKLPKLRPAQLLLVLQFLQSLPAETRFAQTVFIERLQEGLVKNYEWDWPLPVAQQALRTTRTAERALAEVAQEPAVLPWVIADLKKADDWRRSGEKDLLYGLPLPAVWMKAAQSLKEAEGLYSTIRIHAYNVRGARDAHDRALALLVNLRPIMLAQPRDSFQEATAWHDSVLASQKLAKALAKPASASAIGNALEGVSALNQDLNDLQRFFEAKVKSCLVLEQDADGEKYLEIQALLDSPWLDGPRREALWQAGQKLALRLGRATQARDDADNQVKPGAFVPPGPERAAERLARNKRLGARQALDMMSLAGLKSDQLEEEFRAAANPAAEVKAADKDKVADKDKAADKAKVVDKADQVSDGWHNLAKALSRVWPSQLLADFKAGEQDLARADRLGRILSKFDLDSVRSTDPNHWQQNPALALYRKDLADFWQWLGERYQAESAALDTDSPFRTVYRAWAEEYLNLADSMR